MNNDDLQIKLDLLHSGDKKAFEDIYNELKTPVYTIILRIVRERCIAEDVLQEFFLKLYKQYKSNAEKKTKIAIKNPRAYLFKIAHNMAIDAIKKNPQEDNIDEYDTMYLEAFDSLSYKLDIERGLMKLTLLERQIVVLHINAELKFREIAEIVEKPLGTVLWHYRKAIDKLRVLLEGGNS
ncbi:MAG: sigma-70 family RNA polymerase sigma factor [Lachnospiraceae bacterium]|nr:sigma-70 family RNA polymerase sigma factor [Lachnospiraceae bacterium]